MNRGPWYVIREGGRFEIMKAPIFKLYFSCTAVIPAKCPSLRMLTFTTFPGWEGAGEAGG